MKNFKITVTRIFLSLMIISISASAGLAAETDWISPTAHAPGPLFDGFETNPTGAYAAGGLIAQDDRANTQGSRGDEHRYYGFDLSTLPAGENITGIAVMLTAKKVSKQDVQMVVMVSKDNLNTWTGTSLATGDLDETLTDRTLGGETELWGLGATTSDELKSAFFLKIQNFSGNNAPKTWELDWLRVKIYYGGAPDLAITKTPAGNFTQGQTGTYTITVSNIGTATTTGAITVTDTLPLGLSYNSFTGTDWIETSTDPLTFTYTAGTLTAGGSSTITLNVDVAADAPPTVTNTAVVSGGGESNTANNTATHNTPVIQLVPNLIVTKSVIDENGGNLVAEDFLLYTVVIQNPTGGNLVGAVFTDAIPANTTYVANSASAPAGAIIDDSSSPLSITSIAVSAHSQVIITFRVQVNSGVSGVTISNTGTVYFNADGNPATGTDGNEASQATDGDTTTPSVFEPTTIDVADGPNFDQTTKSVALLIDDNADGFVSPEDTLRYTIVIRNTGDTGVTVEFTDNIPTNTSYVADSLSEPVGSNITSITPTINITGINLPANSQAIISFDVEINIGLSSGDIISNFGTVTYVYSSTTYNVDTDADLTAPGKQTTDVTIGGMPYGLAIKSALDENGGNLEPGDTILYTIIFQNQSNLAVYGIEFTDPIPNNTSYIPGSASIPPGSVLAGTDPAIHVTGIDMPAHTQETITFRVRVHDATSTPPLPDGVTQISNQGTVFYDSDGDTINDATQLTDGDTTQPGNQPTVLSLVTTGPNFDQTTKSVAILTDTAPLGIVNTNDTLQYTIVISNTGDTQASGVTFTDPIPAGTSYSGGATASAPTINDHSGTGPIDWSGDINAGASVTITFDVTVTALSGIISNQGTVTYNSVNTLTDANLSEPGKQPTDVTIGGTPYGVAVKIAIDENGGSLEPGDIIRYEILFDNQSPAASTGMEFTDTIPNNTTYIGGSATVPTGSNIVSTDPTLYITGIDVAGTSQETITFRVRVDNPLPAGVTQISNQGTVFYDSDGVGGNDATQLTDGDASQPGNQPTVSTLAVGTISGTVFDDNGDGGGTAFDGIQNGSEPGYEGATVQLLDEFYTLLYGTLTIIDGYYEFTGLPSGDYHVFVPNPTGYTGTTPDILPVTLDLSGGGQTVDADFGLRAITGAGGDLSIVMQCSALYPGGYPGQLITTITIANSGPDTVTGIVLTEEFSALIAAGLETVGYSVDNGAKILLTDNAGDGDDDTLSLSLTDITPGDSTVIRIYADVDVAFDPVANTAAVSAANDISAGDNTAFCTNPINDDARRALDFDTQDNAYVTVSGTSDFNLTTTGTLEAWVNPSEFTEDAGIIVKGTTQICYGMGLGGGTIFSDGEPDNICFVVYDSNNTKHVLAAEKPLVANKWHHVACVWNSAAATDNMIIYINGVLEISQTVTIGDGDGIGDVRTNAESLIIGMQPVDPETPFTGTLDEVRVWNTARTAQVIREAMCRKIVRQSVLPSWFPYIMGYWRFDENSGPVCGDVSGRGNIGIITNALRVCSSAPIGDESAFDYDATGGFTKTFYTENSDVDDFLFYSTFAQDEYLTVSADQGDWSTILKSGLQIYWVKPTSEKQPGPMGTRLLDDRGFWGVFITGGENPTYKIEYNYDKDNNGTPGIGDENDLQLNYRHGNCERWKRLDATPTANTLTKTGLSGTEFILGTDLPPRNAILFDGSDDVVTVAPDAGDTSLDLTTDGTLEAWVYVTGSKAADIIMRGDTTDGYFLSTTASGSNANIVFSLYGGVTNSITAATPLVPNTWYHVAATWDNDGFMNIYINGVLDPISGSTNGDSGSPTGNLYIGGNGSSGFQGQVDEVRVWNIARNQTAIRDTMCQKLAGDETGLMGYWRFDEETDSCICPDETVNDNDGIMSGFGTCDTDAIRAPRICSSAPIGDDSAHAYHDPAGPAVTPVTAQLAHSDGDYMNVLENGGTWTDAFSGIHIYRVDEAPVYPSDLWIAPDYPVPPYGYQTPNGLTPPANWSSIDYYRYWGVFVTDWDDTNGPAYDVDYYYNGNPNVPAGADGSAPPSPQIGLAKRPEYCFGTWADPPATWDFGNSRLRLLGEYQFGTPGTSLPTNPEYILGGINQPLAIALASFTAKVVDGCIDISWETATEIDTLGFQLWRSTAKKGPYAPVGGGFIASNSPMETMGASYDYTDCDVETGGKTEYYYKLEEIDMDSGKDNAFYGPIGPVREGMTASQTAPKNKSDDSGACFIGIMGD